MAEKKVLASGGVAGKGSLTARNSNMISTATNFTDIADHSELRNSTGGHMFFKNSIPSKLNDLKRKSGKENQYLSINSAISN